MGGCGWLRKEPSFVEAEAVVHCEVLGRSLSSSSDDGGRLSEDLLERLALFREKLMEAAFGFFPVPDRN